MGRIAAVVLACLLTVPALARPAAAAIDPVPAPVTVSAPAVTHVTPDQPRILVRFRPDATAGERDRAIASVGGTLDRVLDAIDVTRVALPIAATDAQVDQTGLTALRLARDPAVISVEPDSSGSVEFTPSDTYWATDPRTGVGQWGMRAAQVDKAWDAVRGAAAITVAVIDTGIDANHPDLAGVALPGVTFVSAPDPTCTPGSAVDDNGHGTHVAGIIAANGNNGQGIAGAAFGVHILPVKALDCTGSGMLSDVALGVTWATDHGARIINISLGSSSAQSTLEDAIRYAVAHNVLVVAAAGNCGVTSTRCGSINEPQYPGAFPESLAVGATDTNDAHASFSTIASYVAISAPGVNIWSTTPTYPTTLSRVNPANATYAPFSGTSQASPLVAGVAALVLSREPGLTVAQLTDRLKSTADDLGAVGPDPVFGSGRVNALRAVTASSTIRYGATYDVTRVPRAASFTAPFAAPVTLTNLSSFSWPAGGANPVRLAYHWTDLSGNVVVWDGQRTALPADVPIGGTASLTATVAAPTTPGTYVLRLDLVREGVAWFSSNGAATGNVTIGVTSGLAASYAPAASAQSTFLLGANAFTVTVANTGTVTWPSAGATPVHLSYHWLSPTGQIVVWDGARASLPNDVAPGQAAVVTVSVASPPATGAYTLRLDLVQEGVSWFSGQGVAPRDVAITVTNGFGATYAATPLATALLPGGRALVPVTLTNSGLVAWPAGGANPVHLAVHVLDVAGQVVAGDGERSSLPSDVAPGQTIATSVAVNAPKTAGVYAVQVDLVREGIAWLSSYGIAPATIALRDVADYSATIQLGSTTISRAAPHVPVTVTNTSVATWSVTGADPVDLSAHWLAADGSVLLWDGPRTLLGQPIAPGATATFDLALAAPPPGAAALVVDLVAEGLRWFGSGSQRVVTLVP